MADVIDITSKLPPSPELIKATNMSSEIINILNKYRADLREDLFAGVVADCLSKVLKQCSDKQIITAKCLSYIVHQVENVP